MSIQEIKSITDKFDKKSNDKFENTVIHAMACFAFGIMFMLILCTYIEVCKIKSSLTEANANTVYHATGEALIENGFYLARIYGDYSDLVFDFDAYLDYIGATNVQKSIYQRGDGTVHELRFDLEDKSFCLETTVFKTESYAFGLYTRLGITVGEVEYSLPTNNSGNFVSDANSPMMFDYEVFDILHCVTDKDSTYRRNCQAGIEDNGCPFRGLGMAHYEQWSDGEVIWHDDYGEPTNLHY